MSDGRDLTLLTTCGNPMEAGALREYLVDQGVFCYVQGEHNSSMLGQFGSMLIELRLLVPKEQLQEAAELLQAFRGAEPLEPGEFDEHEDYEFDDLSPNPPRAELRVGAIGKNPKLAALLAIVPSFGFGHFYSGAMFRGLILAHLQALGLWLLFSYPFLGGGLIAVSMLVDLADGMICASLRRDERLPALPAARVIERD